LEDDVTYDVGTIPPGAHDIDCSPGLQGHIVCGYILDDPTAPWPTGPNDSFTNQWDGWCSLDTSTGSSHCAVMTVPPGGANASDFSDFGPLETLLIIVALIGGVGSLAWFTIRRRNSRTALAEMGARRWAGGGSHMYGGQQVRTPTSFDRAHITPSRPQKPSEPSGTFLLLRAALQQQQQEERRQVQPSVAFRHLYSELDNQRHGRTSN